MWREGNQTKGRIILPGLPLNVEDMGVVCMSSENNLIKKQLNVYTEGWDCDLEFVMGLAFVALLIPSPPFKSNQKSE